jgi:hypothetical protein
MNATRIRNVSYGRPMGALLRQIAAAILVIAGVILIGVCVTALWGALALGLFVGVALIAFGLWIDYPEPVGISDIDTPEDTDTNVPEGSQPPGPLPPGPPAPARRRRGGDRSIPLP